MELQENGELSLTISVSSSQFAINLQAFILLTQNLYITDINFIMVKSISKKITPINNY